MPNTVKRLAYITKYHSDLFTFIQSGEDIIRNTYKAKCPLQKLKIASYGSQF